MLRDETEALTVVMESPATMPDEKLAAANRVDDLFRMHKCHPLFPWDWVIPVAFPVFFSREEACRCVIFFCVEFRLTLDSF